MCARERLLKFIAYKGISRRQFYIKAGLSSGFLAKNKSIGSSNIEKMIGAYPDLSVEWVILGSGDMLLPKRVAVQNPENLLPLLDVPTIARELDLSYKNEAIKVLDKFFFGKSYMDCETAVYVWGEDMRPEFCPGDIAALRRVKNIECLQWGFAHVIITEEQHFFKRIRQSPDQDKIRLLSNQVGAEFFEVCKGDITRMYEVRAVLRKLIS